MKTFESVLYMAYVFIALFGWCFLVPFLCIHIARVHLPFLFSPGTRKMIRILKEFRTADPELFQDLVSFLTQKEFQANEYHAAEFSDRKKNMRIYGDLIPVDQKRIAKSYFYRKILIWILSPEVCSKSISYKFNGKKSYVRFLNARTCIPFFGEMEPSESIECSVVTNLGIQNGGFYHDCCPDCGKRLLPELFLSNLKGIFRIRYIEVDEEKENSATKED